MFTCNGCGKETVETTFGAYMGHISHKPVCRSCFDDEKEQIEEQRRQAGYTKYKGMRYLKKQLQKGETQ